MAEIPEKDRCRKCGGAKELTIYWQSSPRGPLKHVGTMPCDWCEGTGIDPRVGHRHPLAGPPWHPNHACELQPVVVPAGIHDVCRVEDYDQAAEDAALLDGIAAAPGEPGGDH